MLLAEFLDLYGMINSSLNEILVQLWSFIRDLMDCKTYFLLSVGIGQPDSTLQRVCTQGSSVISSSIIKDMWWSDVTFLSVIFTVVFCWHSYGFAENAKRGGCLHTEGFKAQILVWATRNWCSPCGNDIYGDMTKGKPDLWGYWRPDSTYLKRVNTQWVLYRTEWSSRSKLGSLIVGISRLKLGYQASYIFSSFICRCLMLEAWVTHR